MLMALELVSLTPVQALGIPVALIGAVFLAVGTQLQHRGVQASESAPSTSADNQATSGPLGWGRLRALASSPAWLLGTVMLGVAVALQLTSLFLAPLTVVQPLGAVALVLTAVLNARLSRTRLSGRSRRGIGLSVGGVGLFVSVAAATTASSPVSDIQLYIVIGILGALLAAICGWFALARPRVTSILAIVLAGVLFGFVATMAKITIDRIHLIVESQRGLAAGDWLVVFAVMALTVAGLAGSYFVQLAHSSGPPDLVVAGLTVVDPIVGVTIGVVVLGEAAGAPLWAAPVFVVAGAVAVLGVFDLAKSRDGNPAKSAASVQEDQAGS